MGELTACNYCNLQKIRKQAKKEGLRVTLLPADWGLAGRNVFVHPKEVKIAREDSDKNEHPFRVAWMMEISDACEC